MANDHDEIVIIGIKVTALEEDVKDLTATVKAQTASMDRYKGVIGGIMLTGSLLVAAVTLFFNYIKVKS